MSFITASTVHFFGLEPQNGVYLVSGHFQTLSFSFSFWCEWHNCHAHSNPGRVAGATLSLSSPFHNTWLVHFGLKNATIKRKDKNYVWGCDEMAMNPWTWATCSAAGCSLLQKRMIYLVSEPCQALSCVFSSCYGWHNCHVHSNQGTVAGATLFPFLPFHNTLPVQLGLVRATINR